MKPTLSFLALLVAVANAAPAPRPQSVRQNQPEIPEVARKDAIACACYTVNQGVLKLTAQLDPRHPPRHRGALQQLPPGQDLDRAFPGGEVGREPHGARGDGFCEQLVRGEMMDASGVSPTGVEKQLVKP